MRIKTVTNNNKTADLFNHGSTGATVTLHELAKDYLLRANLKYGASVNTFEVLREYGIEESPALLRDGKKYMKYYNLASRLGDEITEHLNMFGFKADKKLKPKYEGFDNAMHINGNMVYTNYPWTVVAKSVAAVTESINAMKGSHDAGIDLTAWEELFPEEVERWHKIAELKRTFGEMDMMDWKDNIFDKYAIPLHEKIIEEFEERAEAVKDKQPVNYGRYANG